MWTQMNSRAGYEVDDSRLRLQTIVRLRWIAIFGQLIAIGIVWLILQYDLPVGFLHAVRRTVGLAQRIPALALFRPASRIGDGSSRTSEL